MIYIQEHSGDSESVTISVDGFLTGDSIDPLREVIIRHLREGKTVSVNLKKVNHISRESKAVLREFEGKGILIYDERCTDRNQDKKTRDRCGQK